MRNLKQSLVCLLLVLMSLISNSQNVVKDWQMVVSNNDVWNYFVGTSEPASNWYLPNFDASGWSSGSGGFGYGDGDDNTVIPATSSVYLQKTFTITDTSVIAFLILHADYDDAFVAYLNGTELARSNIGVAGVRPSYNALASDFMEAKLYAGGQPDEFIFNKSEFKPVLKNGVNTLAIQVHNFNAASSDLSSNFFLSLGISDNSKNYRTVPSWFQTPDLGGTLPKMVITTQNNATIQNEPKITAHMGIINNGKKMLNKISDPYTDYDGAIGIEIRGASSQDFPKKNYSLETRLLNGDNNNVSLFGMPVENDWILHGPYSDKSLLRNVLAYHMGKSTGRYTPRTQLCELYINDNYEGVYMFTEKLKRDSNRVDIAKLKSVDVTGEELTGGYLFQIDRDDQSTELDGWYTNTWPRKFVAYADPAYDELVPVQREYLKEFYTGFEDAMELSSYQTNYGYYVDQNSWVDYFLITEIGKHIDAYKLSFYMHKKKSTNGGKIHFGPLWDFNLGFGNFDFACSPDPDGWSYEFQGTCDNSHPFWIKKLTEIPTVSDAIHCRWNQLREGPLHTDSLMQFIDNKLLEMGDAPTRNFERWDILGEYIWPNDYYGDTYEEEVSFLKAWLRDRLGWMDDNMLGKCVVTSVGSLVEESSSIGLYPNPAADHVFIEIDFPQIQGTQVEIRNILGVTLLKNTFESDVQRMDVSSLPSGLYNVCIIQNNEVLGNKSLSIY